MCAEAIAGGLSEAAPAKLNLFLHITGRRADGYHLLDSLVAFADVSDHLRLSPDTGFHCDVTGPNAAACGDPSRNLALRAVIAMEDAAGRTLTARLTLEKNLPVGGGLGGGSSDAAAVIRLLERYWNQALPLAERDALALSLGADVPVCLTPAAQRMQGIGEKRIPARIPVGIWCVLAHPAIPIATPEVFGRLAAHPVYSGMAPADLPDTADRLAWLGWLRDHTTNDLYAPACVIVPQLPTIIAAIAAQPGCHLAQMSGSGSCCFGLFTQERDARAAEAALKKEGQGWWTAAALLS